MADSTAKANALIEKANKKLKGWSMFGSSTKYEDAAELLTSAANHLKLAKAWKECGDVHKQLAGIHNKLGSQHEEASSWVEAGKALMKIPSDDGIMCLNNAVEIYTDMGRLNQAARYLRDIAEQLEKQAQFESSIEFYVKAADLFMTEDSNSEANKCRLKVALFKAKSGNYKEAVEVFEDVARQAVEHNLLKYSAKGHLLNAGLCRLCYEDPEKFPAMLDRYKELDISFAGSRECNLLQQLSDAVIGDDVQLFTDEVAQYDAMSKLDEWKTSVMLVIKRRIQNRKEGGEDEDDDDILC
eukprot:evm.model.scf_4532.1 EVM.evm.TU.scf_4532.1   scf_4532:2310-6252(-)